MTKALFHCRLLLLPLSLIFLISACQKDSAGSGLQAASSQMVTTTTGYAAVVEILLPQGIGFCTGTFVAPRAVLTASHCAQTDGTYQIVTSFGTYQATTHENLGSGNVDDPNDIAMLILSQDAASTSQAQILPIGSTVAALDEVRLVGFGCDNVNTRAGGGTKRTGTNQVASIDDYLDLDTPAANVGILGPDNRAGSCFGDSGGPMLRSNGQFLEVVGVVHAGGQEGTEQISEYVNLTRADNLDFLHEIDANYSLGLFTTCSPDAALGSSCRYDVAFPQIISSLILLWHKLLAFFF